MPISRVAFKKKFLELMDWCERYNKTLDETLLLSNWWNDYYGTGSALSEEERRTAQIVIEEMIRDELIARARERGFGFLTLRPKGREILKKGVNPEIYALRPSPLVADEELVSTCLPLFEQELYEVSIREAFTLLEQRIRKQAALDAGDIGVDLVDRAFGPKKAVLEIPLCVDEGERLGVHQLFRGAIGLLKNPMSHRSVPQFQDRRIAAEILVFCDFLLNILKTAVRRQSVTGSHN